ncbi:MAG: GTP-binding protein EngB [Archaeoglobus sp.]|nr:GTP-binding protein EngB [Archaeoglobus sp.]
MNQKILAEVVFAGRSNVGKSTLFSDLFGVDVRKGRKPGTTIKPNSINLKGLQITDLPGYGFIQGVSREFSERVKDFIVHYIENYSERILVAIQVIDGRSFIEIVERWEKRGEIPIDIEMHQFLNDFDFPVFLAVNKMDRVEKKDYLLNIVAQKMGMIPPWTNWKHRIFPISAKKGETENIRKALKKVLADKGFGGILR